MPAHLWVRAETRANERRVGLMPEGAAALMSVGVQVTVEEAPHRIVRTDAYAAAGCAIAAAGSWTDAPRDAVIFGLKELPEGTAPLHHAHVMFGHAFKGQPGAAAFLARFRAGGGALYDLEYLVSETGRRVAAFGHWAGYAGAALSLLAWGALPGRLPPVGVFADAAVMAEAVRAAGAPNPSVIIIGAKGRVGGGAAALCRAVGVAPTEWDMAETSHGGPFREVLAHNVFLNCILAAPGVPVFVPREATSMDRSLRVVGDIACDPGSDYNPVPIYDRVTTWAAPTRRVAEAPSLDVMAIDNLPSLLPAEASTDFAAQLLPHLQSIGRLDAGVWGRARATFEAHA
ncbi:MAG: saccharopine dehydrogenase [Pseudomonadota bacterium]